MASNFAPTSLAQEMQTSFANRRAAFAPGSTGAISGTAANPSPNPITPLRRPDPLRPNQGGTASRNGTTVRYGQTPARMVQPANRPNLGGRMQRTGGVPVTYGQTPARDPNGPTSGGVMIRNGVRTEVAPSQSRTPMRQAPVQQGLAGGTNRQFNVSQLATPNVDVASPTTDAAPQTEARNPLTGDGNQQPEGTTQPAGVQLGFSRAGRSVPRGQDAGNPYASRFSTPQVASIYADYVSRLFGRA